MTTVIKHEKGEQMFTFLPQIYHELNPLMLWFFKDMVDIKIGCVFGLNYLNIGLREIYECLVCN